MKTYGEAIKFIKDEPNFTIMDQIHTIKNLINRKAFTLSEKQMEYIHQLFNLFYNKRISVVGTDRRDLNMIPKLHPQTKPRNL